MDPASIVSLRDSRWSPQAGMSQARLRHLWLQRFAMVEELRLAVLAFKERYNQSWIVERHGDKTPAQVRTEQLPPAALAA